jgi:hypothetical protein
MPISRTRSGISRAEAHVRASGPQKNLANSFFLFFPCNPLKLHETTKEKLGDSKEIFGDSKRILGKKKKKFGSAGDFRAGAARAGDA